jgi:NAD-dependent dihydropyrimidine dehydrogenase PreA subunit
MSYSVSMMDPKKCDLLGGCIHICPENVWKWADVGGMRQPVPLHPEKCTGCMKCARLCPEKIIIVKKNGG